MFCHELLAVLRESRVIRSRRSVGCLHVLLAAIGFEETGEVTYALVDTELLQWEYLYYEC